MLANRVDTPLRRSIIAACLLLAQLASACATSGTSHPSNSGRDATTSGQAASTYYVRFRDNRGYREFVDAPLDSVWAALPHAFAALNYKAGPSANRSERLYLTPHLTVQSALYPGLRNSMFIDCGRTAANVEAADEYSVTFAILAWVSPDPSGRTLVEVLIDGSAIQRGASSNKVPCTGTGRLERELVEALEKRLGLVNRRR